mgnify:FL=1
MQRCAMGLSARFAYALTLVSLLLALPSYTTAQQLQPVSLSIDIPSDLKIEVAALFTAVRRGDTEATTLMLERLISAKKDHNIHNLTTVAAGVIPRAQKVFTGAIECNRIMGLIVQLAPDLPQAHFALAKARLLYGFSGVGQALLSVFDGLSVWASNPKAWVIGGANASYYVFGALVVSIIISSLLSLLKVRREILHDIGDLFPGGEKGAKTALDIKKSKGFFARFRQFILSGLHIAVALLLLVLPFMAGLGILGSVLLWNLIILRYSRNAETFSVFFRFFLTAALPVLVSIVVLPQQFDKAVGPAMHSCLLDYCQPNEVAIIEKAAQANPQESSYRIALALHEFQQNPKSVKAIDAALAHLAMIQGDWTGNSQTLQGNLLLARAFYACEGEVPNRDDLEKASAAYAEGLKRWPSSPAAGRGAALTAGFLGDRAQRDRLLDSLLANTETGELEYVARIKSLTSDLSPCSSRADILAELENPDFRSPWFFFSGLNLFDFPKVLPYGGLLEGQIPPFVLSLASLALMLLAGVFLSFRKHLSPATRCPKCHDVSCRMCNINASGYDYCPSCLLEQVRPAFIDSKDLAAHRERKKIFDGQFGFLRSVFAIAVPGSGQILVGRPIRGGLMLFLLGLVISMLWSPGVPITDITTWAGLDSGALPWLPPVLLIVVYFWSAIDVWFAKSASDNF